MPINCLGRLTRISFPFIKQNSNPKQIQSLLRFIHLEIIIDIRLGPHKGLQRTMISDNSILINSFSIDRISIDSDLYIDISTAIFTNVVMGICMLYYSLLFIQHIVDLSCIA